MHCPTCDYELPNDSSVAFCPNCGARIIRNPEAAGSATGGTFPLPPAVAQPSYANPAQPSYTPDVSNLPQQSIPAGVYPAPATNSTAAIVSLVFGILSWIVLPFIGAIVAVVAGHIARREIAASDNRLGGRGWATAGLILGYAHLAVVVIGICVVLLLVVIAARSSS